MRNKKEKDAVQNNNNKTRSATNESREIWNNNKVSCDIVIAYRENTERDKKQKENKEETARETKLLQC